MLVIERRVGEEIHIGKNITLVVTEIRGQQVHLGIAAPKELKITRPDYRKDADGKSRRI